MTQLQMNIIEAVNNGVTNTHNLAYKFGVSERGLRTSVGHMQGFRVEGNDVVKVKSQEVLELEAEIARLKEIAGETEELKLVNLTRHAITIKNSNGEEHVIPPSGLICRVNHLLEEEDLNGFNVKVNTTESITNFPNIEGEVYIVSGVAGHELHMKGYRNFVMVDTRGAEYDGRRLVCAHSFWRYGDE